MASQNSGTYLLIPMATHWDLAIRDDPIPIDCCFIHEEIAVLIRQEFSRGKM